MFGYHDSPNCAFDIWAPNPTAWGNNAVENRAFSPYAQHTQEVEDVIQMIATEQNVSNIQTDTAFSSADMRYIENELYNRYGIEAHLS